ncbi:MAG: UDP-N-acetylmuramate--L-alanine ligase, partial [Angustibacter sp.]
AREDPIAGVSGELVSQAVQLAVGHAQFVPDRSAVVPTLLAQLRDGDVLLFVGAGDITSLADDLLAVA